VKQYEAKLAAIPAPQPISFALTAPVQAQAAVPTPRSAAAAQPAASDPNKPSVEVRLKKVDQLLKQELITKREYDEKKAQILSEF
jgi:hypothetical protein